MKLKNQVIPLCLLLLGAGMIVWGILRDEHQTVLEKAVRICLECIGIG